MRHILTGESKTFVSTDGPTCITPVAVRTTELAGASLHADAPDYHVPADA